MRVLVFTVKTTSVLCLFLCSGLSLHLLSAESQLSLSDSCLQQGAPGKVSVAWSYAAPLAAVAVGNPPSVSDSVPSSSAPHSEADQQTFDPPKAPVSGFSSIMQMMGGLAFVLALFLFCAWLMKRVQGGFVSSANQMKLLGGLSVGTRERVVLLEVNGAQVLLGVAPGRISALHVFPSDESVALEKGEALNQSAFAEGHIESKQHHSSDENEVGRSDDFASKLKQLLSQSSEQRGDK